VSNATPRRCFRFPAVPPWAFPRGDVLTGTLLPEMKLDATRAADIVITYRYLSGLSFGIWMEQLVASEVLDPALLLSMTRQRI
jgi:hypothetical protein